MRAQFKMLKPYKLYRNLTIIFDTKMKMLENSILNVSTSKASTIDIMKSPLFQQNYIRGFYIDKFLDKTLYRKLIETDRMNVYKEIKDTTSVTVCPLNATILKNKNTYYPIWNELENIFNIPGAHNKIRNTENFVKTVQIVQGRIPKGLYKENYVVINSEIFGKEFGDTETSWLKGLSIGSMLYLHMRDVLMRKAYNNWVFAGKKVIIYDTLNKTAFAIPESIEKLSLGKFKWMMKIMHKFATGQTVTEEDLAEEEIVAKPNAGEKAAYISLDDADEISLKNILVCKNPSEALNAFIQANYPNADYLIEDGVVTIEESDNNKEIVKNLFNGKFNLYKSEDNLLDERVFKSVGRKFKVAKDAKFKHVGPVLVKKNGATIFGLTFKFIKSTEKAEVVASKAEAVEKIAGMKNGIPLSAEEKEMMFSIDDRIDEIFSETEDTAEAAKKVQEDPVVAKLQNSLSESRLKMVQNKRAAEVIDKLNEKQDEAIININGKNVKLAEKIAALEKLQLEPTEFKSDLLNKELNHSSVKAMRSSYLKDLYELDQYRIFTQFKDSKDIPIFVESITRTDTSNPLTQKETLTVNFNIANEKPRSMSIDIPKIDADGFMYIAGNRKQFTNQITMMPITKVMQSGELVVQYCTSYNKIYISRSNGNFNRKLASFFKAVKVLDKNNDLANKVHNILIGSSISTNAGKTISLEYWEMSKKIVNVKIRNLIVDLSQPGIEKIFDKHNIDLTEYREELPAEKYFPVGLITNCKDFLPEEFFGGDVPIFSNLIGEILVYKVGSETPVTIAKSLVDLITAYAELHDPELFSVLKTNIYSGNSFTYTRLEVANSYIPLLVFLGYKDGLESLFNTYNIEYKFVGNESAKTMDIPLEYNEKIRFLDGTLWYKSGEIKKDLLFNGIYQLPTEDYNFADFGPDGEGYTQYFIDDITPRYGKALSNFYTLFIDPITSDILRDNDIPNDITGSFLYCNDLLEDSNYLPRFDMNLYRLRNVECLNAMLYKLVAKQIEKYRRGSRGDTAGLLAVRSDALILELNNSPIIEDATLLDPIKESENLSKAVFKGPGAPAYQHAQGTQELRFYDKSQLGILGVGSSFDGNSGMNRRIALNSLITSKRGYVKSGVPSEQLDATNLYSMGELTATFSTRHSDPPRLMMTIGQSGHQIPTKNMQTALISSGAYKTISHFISNEFVFKAPEDGVVEGVDKKLNVLRLKYADGTKGIIELGVIHRRSPDGFFIDIHKTTNLKAGDKFKAGDILAADQHFFNFNGNNTEMKEGTLCKVAVMSRDCDIEDGASVTQRFADKLFSTIVMQSQLMLSKTSNLLKIVKIGDNVKTSDPLAVFEEHLEDKSITEALDKLGSLTEAMAANAANMKTAKYTGKIVDIEVFYNYEIEEYSESLQKLIKAYIATYTERGKNLSAGINPGQFVEARELERIKTGRAKGVPFDGVLINFYTEMEEPFALGNKCTADVALKSVLSDIVPVGKEPLSEYRQDKPIDMIMSPLGVLNRKVPDYFYRGYTQKILMELKFQIEEIINDKR